MAADPKLIKAENLKRVTAIDFVAKFEKNIKQLMTLLGLTRKYEKQPGTVVKTLKVEGTLESGDVAEGEVIPLSHYETKEGDMFEMKLLKWRKGTSLEAINDKGHTQAVKSTDNKMIKQIQSGIRTKFYDFISDDSVKSGVTKGTGTGLQGALAKAWTLMQKLWEDDDTSGFLYFVNTEDIGDYLAKKDITTQTAFGMTYIQAFLGTYDVVAYSGVPKGHVIATAKENIILYYVNPKNGEIAKEFEFITDETGLIGIHHDVDYSNLTVTSTVVSGVMLFAEIPAGIANVTIEAAESGTEG